MDIGINWNNLLGNSFIGSAPRLQVLARDLDASIHDALFPMANNTWISRLRTLIWLAARDQGADSGGWLHIPLRQDEVERIQRYVNNSPIPVELAWGPLWQARWLADEQGALLPPNPFSSPEELCKAYEQSLAALLTGPGLAKETRFDIYNEFMLPLGGHKEDDSAILKLWYPKALEMCRESGIECTVSTILSSDGTMEYTTLPQWKFLLDIGGPPDFLEVHPNGYTDEVFKSEFKKQIDILRGFLPLPITVGECDLHPISSGAWQAIGSADLQEFLHWTWSPEEEEQ